MVISGGVLTFWRESECSLVRAGNQDVRFRIAEHDGPGRGRAGKRALPFAGDGGPITRHRKTKSDSSRVARSRGNRRGRTHYRSASLPREGFVGWSAVARSAGIRSVDAGTSKHNGYGDGRAIKPLRRASRRGV